MTGAISRAYPLRVVLAVTTGLPALASIHETQALLSHMTGTQIWAHQIGRAADVCQKYLRDQYAWLNGLQPTKTQADNADKLQAWMYGQEARHGRMVTVRALPGDAYTVMDPIVEFAHSLENGTGAGVVTGG